MIRPLSQKTPVILFGDHIAAYGVVRALGPQGIPIYLVSPVTTWNVCKSSRYVKDVFVLPHADAHYFEKLLSWGLATVGKEAVLIIAGADEPLDVLPQRLADFPVGWQATFPDASTVGRVREKAITYQIAQKIGIPVPKTQPIKNNEDFIIFKKNMSAWDLPLLLKAEKSSDFNREYGTKGIVFNNYEDLLKIDNIFKEFPKYKGDFLIQDMIPGGEEQLYCLKAAWDSKGQPLQYFMDRKVRSSGQFSSCTLTIGVWDDEVFRLSSILIRAISYLGYASIEFKWDSRDKLYKLMEINGRVSMNNSHALRCGVNLPLTMYNNALGLPVLEARRDPKALPERKILWWLPLGELGVIVNAARRKEFSLTGYARELYGDGYIVEPFFWRDPLPGIYSLLQTLGKSVKRALKVIKARLFSRKTAL